MNLPLERDAANERPRLERREQEKVKAERRERSGRTAINHRSQFLLLTVERKRRRKMGCGTRRKSFFVVASVEKEKCEARTRAE